MPSQNDSASTDAKKSNGSGLLLPVIVLFLIVAFLIIKFIHVQQPEQPAAALSATTGTNTVSKASMAKSIPGMPKIPTTADLINKMKSAPKPTVQIDKTLDGGANTSADSKSSGTSSSNKYDTTTLSLVPYTWTNPSDAQTLALATGSSGPALSATHRFRVVSSIYGDSYIPLGWSGMTRQLVGTHKNPSNGLDNYSYPSTIYTSSNVTTEQLALLDDNGNYEATISMLKVPTGQYAEFRVVYNTPTATMYPDDYYSEMTNVTVVNAWPQGSYGLSVYAEQLLSNYNNKDVPSTKSKTVTVVGETGPYILNWSPHSPGIVNANTLLTFTGPRFDKSVTVKVTTYPDGQTPTITNLIKVTTGTGSDGNRTFSFTPSTEGITLSPGGESMTVSVTNANGQSSNTTYFYTQ